jgi:hypothetical protein
MTSHPPSVNDPLFIGALAEWSFITSITTLVPCLLGNWKYANCLPLFWAATVCRGCRVWSCVAPHQVMYETSSQIKTCICFPGFTWHWNQHCERSSIRPPALRTDTGLLLFWPVQLLWPLPPTASCRKPELTSDRWLSQGHSVSHLHDTLHLLKHSGYFMY